MYTVVWTVEPQQHMPTIVRLVSATEMPGAVNIGQSSGSGEAIIKPGK